MSEFQELTPPSTNTDGEIDLKELFIVLWRGKFVILGVTFLAALLSVVVSLRLPDLYSTTALLAPKNSESGGLRQMAAQYGGLASLAGITLGGGGGTDTAIAIETLKSRRFFRDYIYEIALVELMAAKSWQPDTNKLVLDSEIYEKGKWVREVDHPRKPKPSLQEAFEVFSGLLGISENAQSGFVTVSIEHLSPVVAKQWVDLMVKGINEATREATVVEAQRAIDFLTEQVQQTALVSLDAVFAQLIEEQTKTMMLAHASEEYVFQVIDPPVISESKAKPQRAVICVLGTLLGGIFAVFVVLVNHYVRGRR